MMRDRSLKFILVALLVLLPGASSWAQAAGANISGVVKDASNTGLGGVQVSATSSATKAAVTGTTDKDGNYTLAVPAGSYSVTASLAGFKKVTQAAELAEGASVKLDFALDAELTEEITVTAMKREESVQDVPFSVAAPTEQELQERIAEPRSRRRRRERRRVQRSEPRARPKPGLDARRADRPGRARSAWREGAGRHLSRRVRRFRCRCSHRTSTWST